MNKSNLSFLFAQQEAMRHGMLYSPQKLNLKNQLNRGMQCRTENYQVSLTTEKPVLRKQRDSIKVEGQRNQLHILFLHSPHLELRGSVALHLY